MLRHRKNGVMSIAIEFFPKARHMFTQDTLYTLMSEFGDKENIFHDEDDFQLQLFKRMEERYGNVFVLWNASTPR